MTTDPVELITKVIPDLYNAAMKELRAAADAGDADAKKRHGELLGNSGAIRIVLEGKGGTDVYLVMKGETMTVSTSKPDVEVLFAGAGPAEAAQLALEEYGELLDKIKPRIQRRWARAAGNQTKATVDKLVKEKPLMHLVIKDTPDFDEIRIKVGAGVGEPPQKAQFTVAIDYDTLEDVRDGKLKPQAIVGRLQLSGDTARAMQLGMELMSSRSK